MEMPPNKYRANSTANTITSTPKSVSTLHRRLKFVLNGLLLLTGLSLHIAAYPQLSENEQITINQLTQGCLLIANAPDAAAQDLLATCALIESVPDSDPQLAQILTTVAPEEVFAINDALVATSDYQTSNVSARLAVVRRSAAASTGVSSFAAASNSLDDAVMIDRIGGSASTLTGGNAAESGLASRLGVFVPTNISTGETDGGRLQQDTDFAYSSVTAGVDWRFNNNAVAGIAAGALQHDTDFSSTGGGIGMDGFNLSVFGTWSASRSAYVDVVLDLGLSDFDVDRVIDLPDKDRLTVSGSTDANTLGLSLAAGRSFELGAVELGPYVRLSLERSRVDGYTETADRQTPGFASVYQIGDQTIDSNRLSLGATVTKVISTSVGVFTPQLLVEFENQAESNREPVDTVNVRTGWEATLVGSDRDTQYLNISIGASAVFRNNRNAFAFVETLAANSEVTQTALKIGFRQAF